MGLQKINLQKIIIDDIEIFAKVCSGCNILKPLTDYYDQKKGLGGKMSRCKKCNKKYAEENKDRIKNYHAERYINNKDEHDKKSLKYYYENKDDFIQQQKQYKENNKEKIKSYRKENSERINEQNRGYYYKNIEESRERSKKYRSKNKTKERERKAKYYDDNKDEAKRRQRKYFINNKEKFYVKNNKRKAKRKLMPNDLTNEEYQATLDVFSRKCALSGDVGNIHMDHAIPLSVGHGGTVVWNVYPLSETLNLSKHNHNIFEWFDENKVRFNLDSIAFNNLILFLSNRCNLTKEEYKEFVYWCYDNKRNNKEIKNDNDTFGEIVSSIKLWNVNKTTK